MNREAPLDPAAQALLQGAREAAQAERAGRAGSHAVRPGSLHHLRADQQPLSWRVADDGPQDALTQRLLSGWRDPDPLRAERLLRQLQACHASHHSAAPLTTRDHLQATLQATLHPHSPPARAAGAPARRLLIAAQPGDVPHLPALLALARELAPDHQPWLWCPPHAGRAWQRTCAQLARSHSELRVLPLDAHAQVLTEAFDAVCTPAHPLGWDALLAGRRVLVLGTPWWAGWGLTDDGPAARALWPRRRDALRAAGQPLPDALRLFEAGVLGGETVLDPARGCPGTHEQLLDALALQYAVRERYARFGRLHPVGTGMSRWKRPYTAPFLRTGGHAVAWHAPTNSEAGSHASSGTTDQSATTPVITPVLWGRAGPPAGHRGPVLRMEDGFLRSAGLGSDLIAPLSLVLDTRGLYLDPRGDSDLLQLLNHHPMDDALRQRARALRELLVQHRITKYQTPARPPEWQAPAGRRVVLVCGQVDDDASVLLGASATVRDSRGLLARARALQPDAWLVYRPHPDVQAGNRRGLGARAAQALGLADVVDTRADLLSLIEASHEVQVLTSLAGFDALLRGRTVVVHGAPFYAGWGLTDDHGGALAQRLRRLDLDDLVAASLILYPLYWDARLSLFCGPERAARLLAATAAQGDHRSHFTRRLLQALRWLRNVSMGTP